MVPEQADSIRNAIQCLRYCLKHGMTEEAMEHVKRIDEAVRIDIRYDGLALLIKSYSLLVLAIDKVEGCGVYSDLECVAMVLREIIKSLREDGADEMV